MRGAAMNKRNNGRRIFWGRMEPPKMCAGALGRENRVQTILPPDNTVADVLSIEQCCRSMIFRFWVSYHIRSVPIFSTVEMSLVYHAGEKAGVFIFCQPCLQG